MRYNTKKGFSLEGRGIKKNRETQRRLNDNKHDGKRINGRGCRGQGSMEV